MTELDARAVKFLRGLSILTQETGFTVRSCGCCMGPWICGTSDEDEEVFLEDVWWSPKLGEYRFTDPDDHRKRRIWNRRLEDGENA